MNELNELFLFRVKIFEAMGEYKKGIKFVLKYKHFIVDDPRRNECLAEMYMKNNQTLKAIECLEMLIRLNSCNSEFYKKILQANGVDISKRESEA